MANSEGPREQPREEGGDTTGVGDDPTPPGITLKSVMGHHFVLCGRRVHQEIQDRFVNAVSNGFEDIWDVAWVQHLCVFVRKVMGRPRGPLRVAWSRFPNRWQKRFRVEASEP